MKALLQPLSEENWYVKEPQYTTNKSQVILLVPKSTVETSIPFPRAPWRLPQGPPYPVPVINVSAQFLKILVTDYVILNIPCGSLQGGCHQEPVHNDVSVSPDGRSEVSILL